MHYTSLFSTQTLYTNEEQTFGIRANNHCVYSYVCVFIFNKLFVFIFKF